MKRFLKQLLFFRHYSGELLRHCNNREYIAELLINYYDRDYINWYVMHRPRLLKFRNIHQGEDCFIIGNGSSLNKMDLLPLNDYYTFGLNKIHLLLNKFNLDVSFHVAVNPLVIEQSAQEIEMLRCPSFISYRGSNGLITPMDHVYFIITQGRQVPYTFQSNLLQGIHEGYTVTYVAMQIAFFMGFERVFLIGVDHNFIAKGKENEKQYLSGEDLNHFDPTYFSNKEWNLPDLEASELSYHLARFFYSRDNRSIYDATLDGKLNIFPKISYEQALQIAKRKS
jgi:hypothetical protein